MKRTRKNIPKVSIKKVLKLVQLCSTHHCFEFQDLLIDGYKVDIVKRYVFENPNMKFRTWLVDTGLVIKEIIR